MMNNNPNFYNNQRAYGNPNGYRPYNGYVNNGYGYQQNPNAGYYGQGYNSPSGYRPQPYYPENGNYNYYQKLYNMFGGHNPIVEKEFAEICRRGVVTGAMIIGIFFVQILVSFLIPLLPLAETYRKNIAFSMSFGVILQVFYMLLPALAVYLLSKPEERKVMNVFDKPKTWPLYVLGVFAGLALCLAGNMATSFFSVILNALGVTFYSGSEGMQIPTDALSILIFVMNTAIMPALFEEFAFRGVIMQPLRKYGDWFAILISAFCFAIVHANMVQIPFAFFAGVSLGYFCIKTKSIWTSITIHFLNNLISIIFSVYFELKPNGSILPYYILVSTLVIIGIVAMIVFKKDCPIKTKKDATPIGKNKLLKRAAFITTPTMVCAIFFALYMSVSLTKLTNIIGLLVLVSGLIAASFFIVRWTYKIQSEKTINHRKMYTASMVVAIASCTFLIIASIGVLR